MSQRREIVVSLRGSASVAVAMSAMNVATYLYTMLAAHFLGPEGYGAFAAVLNLLIVINVVSLGLQATAARRISADPAHVGRIERRMLAVTWRLAAALGALLLVLAPFLDRLLRLEDLRIAALIAVAAVPLTLMGGLAGILQGERRWLALCAVYLAAGVPRLALGTAMLAVRPTELVAVLVVALGCCAPVVVGWWCLRGSVRPTGGGHSEHDTRSILRESAHNSHALFAYFALSGADIIVARNVLAEHESGLYAAGLILTKAMLFLPQFVVVIAFPSMSTTSERRQALTRGLALVAGLGVVGTAVAWLLQRPMMLLVGGVDFSAIQEQLWQFALLGSILSMLQLLVYAVLARQGRRSTALIWLALVTLVLAGSSATTLSDLVITVIVVDAGLLTVLLVVSLRLVRSVPSRAPTAIEPEASSQANAPRTE